MDITGTTKFLVSREEVMSVGVKERILAIRLMEKVNAKRAYAEALGIIAQNSRTKPKRQTSSDPAGNQS